MSLITFHCQNRSPGLMCCVRDPRAHSRAQVLRSPLNAQHKDASCASSSVSAKEIRLVEMGGDKSQQREQ